MTTAVIEVVNPATGRVVSTWPEAGPDEVAAAVAAAARVAPSWAATPVDERVAVLERLADLLADEADAIVREVSTEMGMPVASARVTQVDLCARSLRSTAAAARDFGWRTEHPGFVVDQVPAGVVAAITPWNVPLYQVVTKVGPALAAGCTVVLKPSEVAPSAVLRFAALAARAGLPDGALGVVVGRGPTTGEALVTDDRVRVVSFTGSLAAGRRVGSLAGQGIKRVALELGGKSASLVLNDADLDLAVPAAVRSAFFNSGQACNAPTRLLVPHARFDEACARTVDTVATLALGDPQDPATTLGPLVSAAARDRVAGVVQDAVARGARVLVGGTKPPVGLPAGVVADAYLSPTVLVDVDPAGPVAQEEVFGPVLVMIPHDGDDDAVRLANATPYGLSAEVWSPDPERVAAVAGRLAAGQVKVNGVRARERTGAPFGGFGLSGVGRELGPWGLAEFCEPRAVLS